ncbi:post-GPI attachment to proteins factor 2-like isoform X1 [Harpegnathos saltator]|uniref:post-GPI attachment to proteins factor 2-like isoform X1 n=1 Tax=Harpegnathos saltator TaxID=610380 RepID=UPI000948C1F4|nr:post-GPI attachment to proteins factor 2-like isoform X1 [Harpegnathos saltator]
MNSKVPLKASSERGGRKVSVWGVRSVYVHGVVYITKRDRNVRGERNDNCKAEKRRLCLATVGLPLASLLFCFVTAYIFQQDDIHETHCKVYNILPSISAITGVSPQRYLWRVSIALHIGPRLVIASVYHSYYYNILKSIEDVPLKIMGSRLLNLCYWLNIAEVAALSGVTYVSNRENYSVHEKIFIVFMISSLMYMLTAVRLGRLITPKAQSLQYKQALLVMSLVSTIGLIIFFLKHRLLCHDLAFSWFSLCEYVIAFANMGFHVTVVLDFPMEQLVVGHGLPATKTD